MEPKPFMSYTDQPEKTGVGPWCAPGPAAEQKCRWILRFEDTDCREAHYFDEEEARVAFARAEARGYNCHLWTLVPRIKVPAAENPQAPIGCLDAIQDLLNPHVSIAVQDPAPHAAVAPTPSKSFQWTLGGVWTQEIPGSRDVKNALCMNGTLNATLDAILSTREPDGIFAHLTHLAHAAVDASFAAKVKANTVDMQPTDAVETAPQRIANAMQALFELKTACQGGIIAGDGKPCPNDHDPDCRWPQCLCREREAREKKGSE